LTATTKMSAGDEQSESVVYVTVPMQPHYEASDDPDYSGYFMRDEDKRQFVDEIANEERALAIGIDHEGLTKSDDLVPAGQQLGYWRDGWVDKDRNLWLLAQLDRRRPDVQTIFQSMKDRTLKWGGSLYCNNKKDTRTGRIVAIDPTSGGFTTNPNLGGLGVGSWAYQFSHDHRAMARVLLERHFVEGAYVPARTLERWSSRSIIDRPPRYKWAVDRPLREVIRASSRISTGDSQSKPHETFPRITTRAADHDESRRLLPPLEKPSSSSSSPLNTFTASLQRILRMADQQQQQAPASTPAPASSLPVPAPAAAAPAPSAAAAPSTSAMEENTLFIADVERLLADTPSGASLATRHTEAKVLMADEARRKKMNPYDRQTGRKMMESLAQLEEWVDKVEKQRTQGLDRLVEKGLLPRGLAHELGNISERPEDSPEAKKATRMWSEFVTAATTGTAQALLEQEKALMEEQKKRKEFEEKARSFEEQLKKLDAERSTEISTLKRGRDEADKEMQSYKRRYEEQVASDASKAVGKSAAAPPTTANASATTESVTAAASSSTSAADLAAASKRGGSLNSPAFVQLMADRLKGGPGTTFPMGFYDSVRDRKGYDSTQSLADRMGYQNPHLRA
jgi:hypothetical protein